MEKIRNIVVKEEVTDLVINDLLDRVDHGINKYGVTLDRKDLTLEQWLQHAYEECLDQAKYLKRAMLEIRNAKNNLSSG